MPRNHSHSLAPAVAFTVPVISPTQSQTPGVSPRRSVFAHLFRGCVFRLPGDRLARRNGWQRFLPGQRLESEEAAVCRVAMETLPLRPAIQERLLRSGTLASELELKKPHRQRCTFHIITAAFFADRPAGCVRLHCSGVQPDSPSLWEVPESGSGTQHVRRTVYLHQVRQRMHSFILSLVSYQITSHDPMNIVFLKTTCSFQYVFCSNDQPDSHHINKLQAALTEKPGFGTRCMEGEPSL